MACIPAKYTDASSQFVAPTSFSGINNTGSYIIVNSNVRYDASAVSAMTGGYYAETRSFKPDFNLTNNGLVPPKNLLIDRPDYWSMDNWDKSKQPQLNTVSSADRYPDPATHGFAQSQINANILENTEFVSASGVSSTLTACFGKRPSYVQAYLFSIPSIDASGYLYGKAGTDTGDGQNIAQWITEFSSSQIKFPLGGSNQTLDIYNFPYRDVLFPFHRGVGSLDFTPIRAEHNPTRGGSAGSLRGYAGPDCPKDMFNMGGAIGVSPVNWYFDTSWLPSVSMYRESRVFQSSTLGVQTAVLESVVIPPDWTSYSQNYDGLSNAPAKGGDVFRPALWRNSREYQRDTINYFGMEGVIQHLVWQYSEQGLSGDWGMCKAIKAVGPRIPDIYDRAYFYNFFKNELIDLDVGVTGGITITGTLPPGSIPPVPDTWNRDGTLTGLFRQNPKTLVAEYQSNPWVREIPYNNFVSPFNDETKEQQIAHWLTAFSQTPFSTPGNFVRNDIPDIHKLALYNTRISGINLTNGQVSLHPIDSPRADRGTLFFNWAPFKLALFYKYIASLTSDVNVKADTLKRGQDFADLACYYSMIFEKDAGNITIPPHWTTGESPDPTEFYTSGQFAYGIVAKGDTNLDHYYFDNPGNPDGRNAVVYDPNYLDANFNNFGFLSGKVFLNYIIDNGFYVPGRMKSTPHIWQGHHGTLVTFNSSTQRVKPAGWASMLWYCVIGKDRFDVKAKINKLILGKHFSSSKKEFSVPKCILDGVTPMLPFVTPINKNVIVTNVTFKVIGIDDITTNASERFTSCTTDGKNVYAASQNLNSKGDVWKYDGHKWVKLNDDNTFSNFKSITAIAYNNGSLYAGTENKIFDYAAGKIFVNEGLGSGWEDKRLVATNNYNSAIRSIIFVGGDIYAAGAYYGIWKYSNGTWSESYLNESRVWVTHLIENDGAIYAATCKSLRTAEVLKYNGTSWNQINTDNFSDLGNVITTQLCWYAGYLYAATFNDITGTEIWKYDGTNWSQINTDGFGSANNYTTVAMAVIDSQLLVTTANPTGGEVWSYTVAGGWQKQTVTSDVLYDSYLIQKTNDTNYLIGKAKKYLLPSESSTTVYTKAQRFSKGLHFWPDGSIGGIPIGNDRYRFFAPNSAFTVITEGTLTDPANTVVSPNLPYSQTVYDLNTETEGITRGTNFVYLKPDFPTVILPNEYYSGGIVYKDPDTGTLLMFCHTEQNYDPGYSTNPALIGFDGQVRLAVSRDDGLSFSDAGKILSFSGLNRSNGGLVSSTSFIPGGIIFKDNYLYFYHNRETFGRDPYLSYGHTLNVCRALKSDVITSALQANAAPWTNYYNGGFTEPSLSGNVTDLITDFTFGTTWLATFYCSSIGKYVNLAACYFHPLETNLYAVKNSQDPETFAMFSDDGINWSFPERLCVNPKDLFYTTVIFSSMHTGVCDSQFYLMNTRGRTGWSDITLESYSISAVPFRSISRSFNTENYISNPSPGVNRLSSDTVIGEDIFAFASIIPELPRIRRQQNE